jgi:diacylglycerol kinase (ATP)
VGRGWGARAFWHAARGVAYAYGTGRNFRVQVLAAYLALSLAWLEKLPPGQVALVATVCGWVLSLEAMNTAVERAVDRVGMLYHPLARAAKDAAAGAVLLGAATALGLGVGLMAPGLGVAVRDWLRLPWVAQALWLGGLAGTAWGAAWRGEDAHAAGQGHWGAREQGGGSHAKGAGNDRP